MKRSREMGIRGIDKYGRVYKSSQGDMKGLDDCTFRRADELVKKCLKPLHRRFLGKLIVNVNENFSSSIPRSEILSSFGQIFD
jgi:hypothetical protein